MKSKKGFTLIELLAVIVILAIIALIATPIVLGIIEDARNNAKKRSAELVIQSVELAYSTAFMADGSAPTLDEVKSAFKMDNANWSGDTITTDDNVSCKVTTTNNNLSVSCDVGENATTSTMEIAAGA